MSEFTIHNTERIKNLTGYFQGLINKENGSLLLKKYNMLDTIFEPLEIMNALDNIVNRENEFDIIKSTSNKLFNILSKNLISHSKTNWRSIPFLKLLALDNVGMKHQMANTRNFIKQINSIKTHDLLIQITQSFNEFFRYTQHYIVMQNVVFPEIEKQFARHGCLKIMWSFHDDIIRNIKNTIEILQTTEPDIHEFNILSSQVYFNINSIIFREEYILFPIMYEMFQDEIFTKMQNQLKDFNLRYVDSSSIERKPINRDITNPMKNTINLSTGNLDIEQLELIFSHLPVDITFVDENDNVKYFSNPPHRLFPRTTSIIGRKVQNCHPQESVHVVEEIVNAFKKGEKNEASFWIKMGPKYILIKYFAVRNAENQYKGTLEVSQEISDIQNIKGEHRLLDW